MAHPIPLLSCARLSAQTRAAAWKLFALLNLGLPRDRSSSGREHLFCPWPTTRPFSFSLLAILLCCCERPIRFQLLTPEQTDCGIQLGNNKFNCPRPSN